MANLKSNLSFGQYKTIVIYCNYVLIKNRLKNIKNITKRKKLKITTIGTVNSSLKLMKHKYKDDKQIFQIKYNNKSLFY